MDRQRVARRHAQLQHDWVLMAGRACNGTTVPGTCGLNYFRCTLVRWAVPTHLQILRAHLQIDVIDVRVEALFRGAAFFQETGEELGVAARQGFLRFDRRRRPHHYSALGAVGESLVHGQICREHRAHHVVTAEVDDRFGFERGVEVARELQQPEIRGSTFPAEIFNPLVAVPIRSPLPLRPHPRFDLERVVVRATDAPDDVPVPCVAIPPLCEHGSGILELAPVRASACGSTDVGLYDERSHTFRGLAMGDVEEDLVKIFELVRTSSIRNDPPVLPQNSEIECLIHARDGYEGRLAGGRRQLFEVLYFRNARAIQRANIALDMLCSERPRIRPSARNRIHRRPRRALYASDPRGPIASLWLRRCRNPT